QQLFIFYSMEGRLRDVPLFGGDVPFMLQVLNPDSIMSSVNWVVKTGKLRFALTSNNKTYQIQYGSEYQVDGIRFNVLPNDIWKD
ncbi:MAG: hypothetical protein J7527_18465, partial [Chitinophagaceae bacterium]|nr:hypothetical protein [Chitinophagaceae bacterium]